MVDCAATAKHALPSSSTPAKACRGNNRAVHGYLLILLGDKKQMAVLVNKNDLANYSQERFAERIERNIGRLQSVGCHPKVHSDLCLIRRLNIASRSFTKKSRGWNGQPSLENTEEVRVAPICTTRHQTVALDDSKCVSLDERRILAERRRIGLDPKVGDQVDFRSHE